MVCETLIEVQVNMGNTDTPSIFGKKLTATQKKRSTIDTNSFAWYWQKETADEQLVLLYRDSMTGRQFLQLSWWYARRTLGHGTMKSLETCTAVGRHVRAVPVIGGIVTD